MPHASQSNNANTLFILVTNWKKVRKNYKMYTDGHRGDNSYKDRLKEPNKLLHPCAVIIYNHSTGNV